MTYTEKAALLGISRRQLYSHRMTIKHGLPIKGVMSRKSTVERYVRRLDAAAAKVLSEQTTAAQRGYKPPRPASQAADIVSAATGRKYPYQKISAMTRRITKEREERIPTVVHYPPPPREEPPIYYKPEKLPSEYTLADARAGLTRMWMDDEVRFMKPGETWGVGRELLEHRGETMTYEEAKTYIKDIERAQHVLVVVEYFDEELQDYVYEVWLDYAD